MKKVSGVLAGLVLSAASMGVSAADSLRVGMQCTYFPFNYKDSSGELSGYDTDIAREVASRIGVDVEFVCQSWDGMIPSLLSEKFDLIVSSMSITETRKKKIDFSVPYRISEGRIIGRSDANHKLFDSKGEPIPEAFEGLKLGLPRASTYDSWVKAKLPDVEILRYDSSDPMYLDLQNGRTDLIFTNPMKGYLSFLSAEGIKGFEFVSPAINDAFYFGTGAGIGIRKGNDELLKKVDAALVDMTTDGTLDKFSHKYFPFAIYPQNWKQVAAQ